MPIITITSGVYSNAESIVEKLSAHLGFKVLTDSDILEETHKVYAIKPSTLKKVADSKQLMFGDLIHTRKRSIACLKNIVSRYVSQSEWLFHGLLGHLVPTQTTHIMKVLIIAAKDSRNLTGINENGLSKKDVEKNIANADKSAFLWTNSLFEKKAWNKSLYDIVVPTDKLLVDDACELITEHFNRLLQIPKEVVEQEDKDFMLTSEIELALSKIGNELSVSVKNRNVIVTINKSVMMLSRLEQKICGVVQDIACVKSVKTKIGKNYFQYAL